MRVIDPSDFIPCFKVFPDIRIDDFDAVVPMEVGDYALLRNIPGINAMAILPPPGAAALCDDKLAFDRWLRESRFARMSPGTRQEGGKRFPYVAKKSHGWSGERVMIIQTEDDESKNVRFLNSEDTLYQDYIDGTNEYCAHFLFHDGKIRFQRTIRHEMTGAPIVKGVNAFPRRSVRLPGIDPFVGQFAELLNDLEFNGPVCIDYKIAAGIPKIMEINPRMGVSVLPSLNEWLDVYLAALGICEPRSLVSAFVAYQRRKFSRRLRRLLPKNRSIVD